MPEKQDALWFFNSMFPFLWRTADSVFEKRGWGSMPNSNSALNRTESRGSHFRSDYPDCDPAMRKSSVVRNCNGEIRFSWETKS